MSRVPVLAGNWKMHGTVPESTALARELRDAIGSVEGREVVVAPTAPALAAVASEIEGSGYSLAAQDVHWEDSGAFTGEVSAPMLLAVGCSHVIIGHSERRQYFGETDARVALKVKAALRHDLTPIVCVGETLEERESGDTLTVIERQVRGGLDGLGTSDVARLILAYEPVWAIGTGKVATPAQAQEVHASIRGILADLAAPGVAAACRILYGGSVKPDNVDSLMGQGDIDGALVGGASLKAADFARIVRFQS
jgi:triosephosphate isomerase